MEEMEAERRMMRNSDVCICDLSLVSLNKPKQIKVISMSQLLAQQNGIVINKRQFLI
jgi:hypothetical protein